eukprot:COSAG05_NODE_10084_length_584_cov_0.501031_1_plen_103_part_01
MQYYFAGAQVRWIVQGFYPDGSPGWVADPDMTLELTSMIDLNSPVRYAASTYPYHPCHTFVGCCNYCANQPKMDLVESMHCARCLYGCLYGELDGHLCAVCWV